MFIDRCPWKTNNLFLDLFKVILYFLSHIVNHHFSTTIWQNLFGVFCQASYNHLTVANPSVSWVTIVVAWNFWTPWSHSWRRKTHILHVWNILLVGCFRYFSFSSLFGEMIQIDEYFSDGLKPPTSLPTFIINLWFSCRKIILYMGKLFDETKSSLNDATEQPFQLVGFNDR